MGGTAAGARNIISGNNGDGVEVAGDGTSGNVVEGNFVGTDVGGTQPLGNSDVGVLITSGATGNTVGGTAAGAGNVVSNNGSVQFFLGGVYLTGSGTSGNVVGGSAALGNGSRGILVVGVSGSPVTGTVIQGNVVSANGDASPMVSGIRLFFDSGTLEGTLSKLIATVNNPHAGAYTFAWTVVEKAHPSPPFTGSGASFSFTPPRPGAYLVSVTATNTSDNSTVSVGPLTFQAANVGPVIQSINVNQPDTHEGKPVTLTATTSDPGVTVGTDVLHHKWSVTGPDGFVLHGASPTFTLTPIEVGTYSVQLTVTDSSSAPAAPAETTFAVTHVTPTAVIQTLPGTGINALSGTLTASLIAVLLNDPGNDEAASATYTWTVKDTTTNQLLTPTGGGASIIFSAPATDSFTVTLTVTDDDNDNLSTVAQFVVIAPNTSTPLTVPPGATQVVAITQGHSTLDASGSTVPVTIAAVGTGHNSLIGGQGPSILVGDSGFNTLVGGSGPDSLIGTHDDVLVGGTGASNLFQLIPGADEVATAGTQNNTLSFALSTTPVKIDLSLNTGQTQSFGGTNSVALTGTFQSLVGGAGRDNLRAGSASNVYIQAGSGNALLSADGGTSVTLFGGSGNDTLNSSGGSSVTMVGGTGNDTMFGSSGNDLFLFTAGSSGNATLYAGSGQNTLNLAGAPGEHVTLVPPNKFTVINSSRVATTTTLASSANPALSGQALTFTATVASGSGTPVGTVDFFDNTTNTDLTPSPVLLSAGVAKLILPSGLAAGTHSITATYLPSGSFLGSISAPLVQTVTLTSTAGTSAFVLNGSAAGALNVSGQGQLTLSGLLDVNSSSNSAISVSGNAHLTPSNPTTGVAPFGDPLINLPLPPSGLPLKGAVNLSGNNSLTISSGVYSQISVSGNGTLTMNPGIYVIAGGGFSVTGGASVTGAGVTIYNAGSSYPNPGGSFGAVNLSGSGNISLTAPTIGTYAGILIFQARDNASAISLTNKGISMPSGVIYAPKAALTVSGNGQYKGSFVVNTLTVSGNAIAQLTAGSDAGTVYAPAQVRTAYGINNLSLDGTGQTIAIVDAYDNPAIYQALDAFDAQFAVASSGATLCQLYGAASSFLTVVNQRGDATALPATDPAGPGNDNWEVESALDVEWAHAVAPGAQIVLVEADSQSLDDLMTAVRTAAGLPGVSVVSMSWGFPEGQAMFAQDEALYDSYLTTPAGHLGVTFVASTGDYGAGLTITGASLAAVAPSAAGTTPQTARGWNATLESVTPAPAWSAILLDASSVIGQLPALMAGALRPEMPAGGSSGVLLGGAGDDLLVGGEGRDLLVGGYSAGPRAAASRQENAARGGELTISDTAALDALMAEGWRTDGGEGSRFFDEFLRNDEGDTGADVGEGE